MSEYYYVDSTIYENHRIVTIFCKSIEYKKSYVFGIPRKISPLFSIMIHDIKCRTRIEYAEYFMSRSIVKLSVSYKHGSSRRYKSITITQDHIKFVGPGTIINIPLHEYSIKVLKENLNG
jgi:hypothetical protein